MASRYTQEYFFQHTLINVSFTDLNKIIHPQAEDIPEYIRHYASAMFVNSSFWDDVKRVENDLKMEGHTQDYISSYMSYIQMLGSTYRLVIKGKFLSPNPKNVLYNIHIYIWILYIFFKQLHRQLREAKVIQFHDTNCIFYVRQPI